MQLPTLAKCIQASKDEVPVARLLEAALYLLSQTETETIDYTRLSQQQIFDAVVAQVIYRR